MSPITAGLMEQDGQLSPGSFAAAQAFKSTALRIVTRAPAKSKDSRSSDDISPASSPIKVATERRKTQATARGKVLVRNSSLAVDSSPKPNDRHTEDEMPKVPWGTSPRRARSGTVNPAKRGRTEDPISDADSAPVAATSAQGTRCSSTKVPVGKSRLSMAPLPDWSHR
ncbi:hypothetical protein BDV93DRAFT_565564 [Ceratobasidium sp. AG-I]|nr:hypothetical protein BDV93DRAFT_565564 [Ceratobasidium sp. AG-I]